MKEYVVNFVSAILLLSLVSGCSKQHEKNKAALKKAAFSFDGLQTNIDICAELTPTLCAIPEIEAKLIDIPSMIGSTVINGQLDGEHNEDNDTLMLAWASAYDQETLTLFYIQEMEQLGWQKLAKVKGFETTLLFQKPKKFCVISIRAIVNKSKGNYNSIAHITVSNKEKY